MVKLKFVRTPIKATFFSKEVLFPFRKILQENGVSC